MKTRMRWVLCFTWVMLCLMAGGATAGFGPSQGSGSSSSGGGTTTFPLLATDGSAGAPSYAFASDHAMGLRRGTTGGSHLVLGSNAGAGIGIQDVNGISYIQNEQGGYIHLGQSPGTDDGYISTGGMQLINNNSGGQGGTTFFVSDSITKTNGAANLADLACTFLDGGTNSTTSALPFRITASINFTGGTKTGHYEMLTLVADETSLPTGTNYLIRALAGTVGNVDKFGVLNTGATIINSTSTGAGCGINVSAPSAATSVGRFTGQSSQFVDLQPFYSGSGGVVGLSRPTDNAVSSVIGNAAQGSGLQTGACDLEMFGTGVRISSDGNANQSGGISFIVAPSGVFGGTRATTALKWQIRDVAGYPLQGQAGMVFGWAPSTDATATADTALSRDAAGVVDFGTGAQGSRAGAWQATNGTLLGTLTLTGATVAGTPTWSSNQAITLSTASQPNITSLGTLSALSVNGALNANGSATANGQLLKVDSSTELLTLSTSGTTTDTAANLLPAGAIILSVTCRITTTITTATNWSVGDATTAARFSTSNSTLTSGTTSIGVEQFGGAGAAGAKQNAAAKVRITTTGTPGAGAIRITVHYIQPTASTS